MTVPPRMTSPTLSSRFTQEKPPSPSGFQPPPRVKRRSPYRPAILTIIAGFIAALVIYQVLGHWFFDKNTVKLTLPGASSSFLTLRPSAPGEKIILIMGVDHAQPSHANDYSFDGARTDTMMLARISTRNKSMSIVSIPRDSKVYLNGGSSVEKINAAHALGGPELAVRTVEESFGIPVDNYVVINFKGVKQLVDTLGGVDVYIEKPMHYRDRTAHLNIDFQPGMNHLNGQQAEEFLRFRHDALGDIGRIRRQQQFIAATTKKLKEPWTFGKIPQLVSLGGQFVKTDLSPSEMVRLAAFVPDIRFEKMRTATLPGYPSGGPISYWIVDPDATQAVLDRLILENNNHLLEGIDQSSPLKVGILYNQQVAANLPAYVEKMEQAGFEVVCRNAHGRASTQIIEHSRRVSSEMTSKLEKTNPVFEHARLIFAPVGSTYEATTCSSGEDYTVILGSDIAANPSR
ncbi:MAG: LCP family protein [Vampirovibrionales bacterium]|nr:LCP family protein [Vampirovibrionales bacterium]